MIAKAAGYFLGVLSSGRLLGRVNSCQPAENDSFGQAMLRHSTRRFAGRIEAGNGLPLEVDHLSVAINA